MTDATQPVPEDGIPLTELIATTGDEPTVTLGRPEGGVVGSGMPLGGRAPAHHAGADDDPATARVPPDQAPAGQTSADQVPADGVPADQGPGGQGPGGQGPGGQGPGGQGPGGQLAVGDFDGGPGIKDPRGTWQPPATVAVTAAEVAGRPTDPAIRPAPGADPPGKWDLGRMLRRFAGADEVLLSWVPQERARYTGMGGAVLFTAVMAFLSMTVALGLAFDSRSPVLLIPALVWFVLILNFDRWLVSAPLAKEFWRRLPTILVRFGMAFLFGVVIAEPLVLAVFNSAVRAEVLQLRADDLKKYQAMWERCNPIELATPATGSSSATGAGTGSGTSGTGTAVASDPACADFVVPLPENVKALKSDFASKQAQLADLQATLKPLNAEHDRLVKKSQDECLGKSGVGLTGRYGNGPVCQRLTKDAADYAKLNRIDQLEKNVVTLTDGLNTLSTQIRDASTEWADQRAAYIAAAVRQRQASEGTIGLLEQIEALNVLAVTHRALGSAIWSVRALFILVDLAPALLKLTSGTTRYDRLVDGQLRLGEMQFAATNRAAMARVRRWAEDDRADLDVERARLAGDRTAEYDRIMDELEQHWSAPAGAAAGPPETVGAGPARGWPMPGSRYTYDPESADRDEP